MIQDSNEHKIVDGGETVVKSEPQARQGTEVRAMRFVLGISLVLVIVGMAGAYMLIQRCSPQLALQSGCLSSRPDFLRYSLIKVVAIRTSLGSLVSSATTMLASAWCRRSSDQASAVISSR